MKEMDKKQLDELIIRCATDALIEAGQNKNIILRHDSQLYGRGGVLDSLGLVRLIAELEQEIYEYSKTNITLADEKAMSQKSSPFLSVSTLSDYILKLLQEAAK